MTDAEKIYDDEIVPALRKIGERCKELGMSFVAQVEYAPGECAHTAWASTEPCFDQRLVHGASLAKGNFDLLAMAVMKYAREHGHQSVILSQLGVPAKKEGGKP